MITPKQYAEQTETPYPTVMRWLQRGLIPGAEKQDLPFGNWYYAIPEDAPKPDLKPGPKPVVTDDQTAASPTIEAAAKPVKKQAGKKTGSKKAK